MPRPRLRLALLWLAASLAACGGPVVTAAPPPPVPLSAPSAAPSASVEAPLPAPSYVMRGTLLGHDGKPMKLAHVHAGGQSTPVDAGGGFRVTASGPGFFPVRFTGVDHAELTVSLYFDGRETELEVTLGTYERHDPPFPEASVVVYIRREPGGPPVPLFRRPVKKLSGGRYGAVLLEKSDEIFYALDDVARGHRMNGAEAEIFEYDGRSSYMGRLHLRGRMAPVVIDPARMPPAGRRPRLRFAEAERGGRAARITSLWFDAAQRVDEEAARGPSDPAWRAEITRALTNEPDALVSAALRLAYLVPPSGLGAANQEAAAIARALLDQLPADAPLWVFAPAAAITAVDLAGRSAEREAYLDRLGDSLHDRDAAAAFAGARLRAASRAGREDDVARLFGVMRARFADTTAAHAVAFYDPARHVRPDHALPDFDLPAMPDGPRAPKGARITRAGLRGKVTLIDFWGIWCGPCVAEMRNLHEVFARHKDAGFTIVSVAVRSMAPDIRRFRATRWAMPWSHVVLEEQNQDEVVDRFEIKSYPSPILVDAEGKILEAGDDLRGEALGRAVAAALRSGASRAPAP